MGLTAGPVPPRVQAPVKSGLLTLIDHAVGAGWSTRRACSLLGLDPDRAAGWRERARAGRLADLPCGGGAVHGLLPDERAAIIELFEAWAGIDRSHRKLAARGSRLELVHASASTVHRVLAVEGLVLQGPPAREPQVRAPWPDWIEWKPGRVWCYDFTHFTRARRVAIAVLDVVSRRWLATLISAEETSTQIEAAFLAALDEEQLGERIDTRLLALLRAGSATAAELDGPEADGVPVLIAMSVQRAADSLTLHQGVHGRLRDHATLRPARHPHRPGLDRVAVRPPQERLAKPGEDPRPRRTHRRARPRPNRVQHRAPARRDRLRHPRRRTPRPRRRHPASPPRRPGPSTTRTHRIPSNEHQEPIMIARRPWLGNYSADDRIKSETPHRAMRKSRCSRAGAENFVNDLERVNAC